jgi:hypothetical protein
MTDEIKVPISPGELLDKVTILRIKSQRMTDPVKLKHVRVELAALEDVWQNSPYGRADVAADIEALHRVNESLWVTEDDIREQERRQDFGAEFVRLARAVYFENDERAAIKRRINLNLGSSIVEEKSYAEYKSS